MRHSAPKVSIISNHCDRSPLYSKFFASSRHVVPAQVERWGLQSKCPAGREGIWGTGRHQGQGRGDVATPSGLVSHAAHCCPGIWSQQHHGIQEWHVTHVTQKSSLDGLGREFGAFEPRKWYSEIHEQSQWPVEPCGSVHLCVWKPNHSKPSKLPILGAAPVLMQGAFSDARFHQPTSCGANLQESPVCRIHLGPSR